MNGPLLFPPPWFRAPARRSASWGLLWIAGVVPSLLLSGAEELLPLVSNSVVPATGYPDSGEAPAADLPAMPGDPSATPFPDGGLQAQPSDPEFADDSLPSSGGLMQPVAALNPAGVVIPPVQESPPPVADSAAVEPSNPGSFGEPLGNFSGFQGGLSAAPGIIGTGSRGFSDNPGALPPGGGLLEDLRDGFSFAATLAGTYDSNPSLGYGSAADSGEGDFFSTLGGSASYLSRASTWTYGANYSGGYSRYFNQSDLSGYNQNAGGSVNYEGGPFSASLNAGIGFGSGANRAYAAVVDEITFNYGLSARYRLSSKTTLSGNFSQNLTSASGSGSSDTSSFSLGASALWRYSALTEFGPGIRYSQQSGDTQLDRSSIGPMMTVNYQLSRKVSLNSQLGLDFAEYEGGESADPSVSAALALDYRASRLWGMNLSLNRNTQADPVRAGQFNEITALRLGYHRKIRRAAWELGVSLESNTSVAPDSLTGGAGNDRDYLRFDTSLGMPVFGDTCNARVFIGYRDQSGGTEDSFDSLQTGFSISRGF